MKSLFEELGGTHHQEGDYFLPDLLPPDSISVGIWGQRRKHYLKTQREPVYAALLLGGKLDSHLSEVGAQAVRIQKRLHNLRNKLIKRSIPFCRKPNSKPKGLYSDN